MRVMLLRDVYKLGRAGDVKRVADGYGRNYLLPQGLATLATEGALKQAERIRQSANKERARLNQELGTLSEQIEGLKLAFPVKASDTGKLYGSITASMIAEAIEEATGAVLERRQIDIQPLKVLGVHSVAVRLTIDLVPEITVLVHREGEAAETAYEVEEPELGEEEEQPEYMQALLEQERAEEEAQLEVPEDEEQSFSAEEFEELESSEEDE